jgi:hypothetical protein
VLSDRARQAATKQWSLPPNPSAILQRRWPPRHGAWQRGQALSFRSFPVHDKARGAPPPRLSRRVACVGLLIRFVRRASAHTTYAPRMITQNEHTTTKAVQKRWHVLSTQGMHVRSNVSPSGPRQHQQQHHQHRAVPALVFWQTLTFEAKSPIRLQSRQRMVGSWACCSNTLA